MYALGPHFMSTKVFPNASTIKEWGFRSKPFTVTLWTRNFAVRRLWYSIVNQQDSSVRDSPLHETVLVIDWPYEQGILHGWGIPRLGLILSKHCQLAWRLHAYSERMYHIQCCQHLLIRNPKIYEENPGKGIGLMGIDTQKILICFICIIC